MSGILDYVGELIIKLIDKLDTIVTEKPFISVIFPFSGLGVSFIPTTVIQETITPNNPVLEFIAQSTPYLKYLFLLLTILLSIVSFILQIRKLKNKEKD